MSARDQLRAREVEEALRPKTTVEQVEKAINASIQEGTKHLVGRKITGDVTPEILRVVKNVLQNIEGYDGDLNKVKVEADPNDPCTLNIDFPQPTDPATIKVEF